VCNVCRISGTASYSSHKIINVKHKVAVAVE
jgi:hypothetical protein